MPSVLDRETPSATEPLPPETPTPSARDAWLVVAVIVSFVALLAAVIGVGFAMRAIDEADDSSDSSGTAALPAALEPLIVEVTLGEFFVRPARIVAQPGQRVVLDVTNSGTMPHDLKVGGTRGTELLPPGGHERVTVGPFRSDAEAWCTVPGHKEAGMVLDIDVSGGSASGSGSSATKAAAIDFDAAPAAEWTPYDPALAPAPGGREHKVTMNVTEETSEVAPGVTQELWTFGGTVPGPVLRGRVGDVFTVTLVNGGKLPHSLDFHASKVAWDDEMRTIQPGESLVYQFEAKHAGIFMYHCGTAPALHHIGNGMYGALVVDPPDLAPVDHEYVLVQSELYLGPQGKPGDLAKMKEAAWDAVVFNGYVSQYKHRPIRVEPHQRVRAWVLVAGPSENSSFHIVGTIFDTVFKEGAYTLRPGAGRGGAQALDLQPAQGGFVEFEFDEAGLYPIVTHKFANPGKGALGLFQAGEPASPAAGASH